MIEKISDILLISDLDGTLFDEPYGAPCRVSEQNREAIRRFISKGGKFAIASGRPHYMAMRIMGDTAVNSLSVFANGSYLHNPETEETSCEIFVDISKDRWIQFSSVTQACLTLCHPMDCSTPGFPVHHQPPGACSNSCPSSR